MKVEFINKNKLKITLTYEDLETRKISLADLEKNANVTLNLIEELDLDEDFGITDSQVLIETSSDNNNLYTITITKIEDLPELKKYSLLDHSSNKKQIKKNSINYKVDSNIYAFSSMDSILDMCSISKQESLFFGKNSLYQYNNQYYIVFSNSATKNKKFLKTFVILSEYCTQYYSLDLFSTAIKEKSKLIIENKALQTLSKI